MRSISVIMAEVPKSNETYLQEMNCFTFLVFGCKCDHHHFLSVVMYIYIYTTSYYVFEMKRKGKIFYSLLFSPSPPYAWICCTLFCSLHPLPSPHHSLRSTCSRVWNSSINVCFNVMDSSRVYTHVDRWTS